MRDFVRITKALSNETRIRILRIILERGCCVCEVMQALEISQSKASRHLSVLYDAGFLKLRKDSLWSLYSIDKESMTDHLSTLVEVVRKALKNNKTAALFHIIGQSLASFCLAPKPTVLGSWNS